jgi:hypothetical protein
MRRARARSERGGECRIAAAQHDEPPAGHHDPLGGTRQQVEALLGIEAPDHPEHGSVVVRVELQIREQRSSAGRLAAPIRTIVRGRQVVVRRRIPDDGIDPVEDPHEPVALGAQCPIEPHAEVGPQRLHGESGADRGDEIGPLDGDFEEIEPGSPVERRCQGSELVERRGRDPAVVGKVVDGQQDGHARKPRLGGEHPIALQQRRARVPVVDVEDVHAATLAADRLEGRAAEQAEAPRIVRVVARRIAVEGVSIERGRVVHEPEAIAVGRDVDDLDLDVLAGRTAVRQPER